MGLTKDDLAALLDAFEASTWQEMTVEVGGDRLHVSRRAAVEPAPAAVPASNGHAAAPPPPVTTAAPPAAPVPVAATAAALPEPPGGGSGTPAATGTPVVSPSVGLFWRAPSPDAPPFVEVGSRVGPEDTVGIVEVMKLMTPVAAGTAGVVSAVLADNGAMVEHGQALVLIAG